MRYCHPDNPDLDNCLLCRKYEADDPPGYRAFHDSVATQMANIAAGQVAAPKAVASNAVEILECCFRGPPTGETEQCKTCSGNVRVKLFGCEKFDKCTLGKTIPGVACCSGCTAKQAARKPWDYRVSICIPHLDTPEQLELGVALWRLQTVKPYFIVIDTGSSPSALERISRLRGPDLEIHCFQKAEYRHPSSVVALALDLAHGRCQTPHLLHTHTDVFPTKRNFLEWLIAQATPESPIAGWRMSPRNRGEWRECVSHTATMIDNRVFRARGLSWNLDAYMSATGEVGAGGWPDTESGLGLSMSRAGVQPKILGDEVNHQRLITDWHDHPRSYTCDKSSGRAGRDMAAAMVDARRRLAEWSGQTPPVQKELKIELGGGSNQKPGFINVDKAAGAEVCIDMESQRLPFDDDSVAEVYSCHALEHIRNLIHIYREILRVCRVGARVEIRVPHQFQSQAMCYDHKCTISRVQVADWCENAVEFWSGPVPKKLKLLEEEYPKGQAFEFWRRTMPDATESELLAYCPDAAYESRWVFTVELIH